MATESRQPAPALAAIEQEPERFDFAAAMRLLECAFADKPRFGRSLRPGDDRIRLGQNTSLAFAAGALAEFRRKKGRGKLLVNLFGLLGPNGPLPLHLTEHVLDRRREFHDDTLASFLDVFHHRLLSLFWRAHADAEPIVEADRPDEDRFARYVRSLFGHLLPAPEGPATDLRGARRYWVGHFARQTRNAEGLAAILTGFFRVPVSVEPFVGRWIAMSGDERCKLGGRTANRLGQSAFLGDEVWDCSQTFRVVLGPVRFSRFESLLPGGSSWTRLRQLVRDYLGDELAWQAEPVLLRDEVPPLHLGSRLRLGWSSWLGGEPATSHRRDVVLRPETNYRHRTANASTNGDGE